MAEMETIRVMVSSRSLAKVFRSGVLLSEVRKRLQAFLASIRWSAGRRVVGRNEPVFDVWIHENDTGQSAERSVFQVSLDEIDRADIVLVLYTGDAGSVSEGSSMGICHAELHAAIARRREIVFLVRLLPVHDPKTEADVAFQTYVETLKLFQKEASDNKSLHAVVAEMLQNQVARLASRGTTIGARKLDRGEALEWNRLNLVDRQTEIRQALAKALGGQPRSGAAGHPLFVVSLSGVSCLVRVDAIPAAASEPAARELVGQPFLRDHLHATLLDQGNLAGPVHIVGCHRTITESQASKMLGTPDAMIVSSDFGIYVADHVQKIQFVLLARCSDVTATGVAVRRFREWLIQSGEGDDFVARAQARQRILAAVAAEQQTTPRIARPAGDP